MSEFHPEFSSSKTSPTLHEPQQAACARVLRCIFLVTFGAAKTTCCPAASLKSCGLRLLTPLFSMDGYAIETYPDVRLPSVFPQVVKRWAKNFGNLVSLKNTPNQNCGR